MKLVDVVVAFMSPRWSEEKLEDASRGLVNGSCDDPFYGRFKYWLEMERSRNEEFFLYSVASISLIIQAIENKV